MDKLDKISYMLRGVNPNSKFSLLWYDIKKKVEYAIPYSVREYYRKNVKTIWKPQHSRIRKAVPRYWIDLDGVLLSVNFEIIKSFYEDEFTDGPIDWNADEKHQNFAEWLEAAYGYVEYTRPLLLAEIEAAYPEENIFTNDNNKCTKSSYKKLYGEVDRLEKHIHKMDTKVLTELIKYRDFLWT
jgi:hypothetical protein